MDYKNNKRYLVPIDEDFEPDSNQEVLKNYLGIKSRETMEKLEYQELERTEIELLSLFDAKHQFNTSDICNIHELWLGDIYLFAGKYRTVTMSKDGFIFAAAHRIAEEMANFEHQYLTKYTPCNFSNLEKLALALGIVHVELIIIHPFREGNGRTARLFADLMAMQSNQPPLNFADIDQIHNSKGFQNYVLAIHQGFNRNYEPIQEVFKNLLKTSQG